MTIGPIYFNENNDKNTTLFRLKPPRLVAARDSSALKREALRPCDLAKSKNREMAGQDLDRIWDGGAAGDDDDSKQTVPM